MPKFIPDSDSRFAMMARNFAWGIAQRPEVYGIDPEESEHLTAVVQRYRDALSKAIQVRTRTKLTIMMKDEARAEAERLVRKFGNLIRANDSISMVDKIAIGVRERPKRLRKRACPQEKPWVRFLGPDPRNQRVHVLEFRQVGNRSKAKPAGAVRLELFVGLVGADQHVPREPSEYGMTEGGVRTWYHRSYTQNPMRVRFPMPNRPMLVVYWGRWADATGDVGPWSDFVQARVEGWMVPGAMELPPPHAPEPLSIGADCATAFEIIEPKMLEGEVGDGGAHAIPALPEREVWLLEAG